MSVHSYSRYWLYLISTQEEHHQKKSFWEEYGSLVKLYELRWVEEETALKRLERFVAGSRAPR